MAQDARGWLDKNYPPNGTCVRKNEFVGQKITRGYSVPAVNNFGKKREEIKGLYINNQDLVGELDLSGFRELETLEASDNKITRIDLADCPKLFRIQMTNNILTDIDLSSLTKLLVLYLNNNNLRSMDLSSNKALTTLSLNDNLINANVSIFSDLEKIQHLYFGTSLNTSLRADVKKQNKFTGSLESLKCCVELRTLDIKRNDQLVGGLEDLPSTDLERFECTGTIYYWILKEANPSCTVGSAGVRKWQKLDYNKRQESILKASNKKGFEPDSTEILNNDQAEIAAVNAEKTQLQAQKQAEEQEARDCGCITNEEIRRFIASKRLEKLRRGFKNKKKDTTNEAQLSSMEELDTGEWREQRTEETQPEQTVQPTPKMKETSIYQRVSDGGIGVTVGILTTLTGVFLWFKSGSKTRNGKKRK